MRANLSIAVISMATAAFTGCIHSATTHSAQRATRTSQASQPVAEPDRPSAASAARSFDVGVEAFARRDYAASLTAFDRAYRLAPNNDVLFNLARTHDALGHDVEAARYYVAYKRGNTSVPAAVAREIEDALFRIQSRVGWVIVRGRTAVLVDGEALAFLPRGSPIAVAAGVHTIRDRDNDGIAVAVRSRPGEVLALSFGARDAVVLLETQSLTDLNIGTNAVLSTALFGR